MGPHSETPEQSFRGAVIDDASLDEWVHRDVRRTERIIRFLSTPLWDIGFRQRSYGAEHVPRTGGVLLVTNHASYVDPLLAARGQHRVVRFMTKAPLFDIPLIGTIVRAGGGFPVHRGAGDRFAYDLAVRLLHDGQPVTIFPEGTRYRSSDELGPAKRGAARLALETGVPVVPVAIYGTKPRAARGEAGGLLPRRPKVTVLYGAPLRYAQTDEGNPPHEQRVAEVRDEIWAEVGRLYGIARKLTGGRRPRTFAVPSR